MCADGKFLRSGDLARLSGVSADTIRHYEHLGLLPEAPRTSSAYRMYGQDAAGRVQLVQRALQLGFTLTELAEILRTRDAGGVPCHRVLRMTEEKLLSLGKQIQELRRTERYMRKLVREWQVKLGHTKPESKAMLLHSLPAKTALLTKPGNNFKRRKP
jgi:MerR family mercuric resistance operon transcriptional regulator